MRSLVPALLIILMAYFTPLPPAGDCPVHGPTCAHGSSCPAARAQLAQKAAASCHTGHDAVGKAEGKRFRCAITSCHNEGADGLLGVEAPFIVDLAQAPYIPGSSTLVRQTPSTIDFVPCDDITEPPEGPLFS